jgi:hypothetical protein
MKNICFVLILIYCYSGFSQYVEGDEAKKQKEQKEANDIAQKPKKSGFNLKDRGFVGGGFGLQFGTITNVNISPNYIVRLDQTSRTLIGAGVSYQYFEDRTFTPSFRYRIFSPNIFLRQVIAGGFYTESIYEHRFTKFINQDQSFNVNLLFLGGGYQNLIGRSFINFGLYWNVLENPYFAPGPYPRFGFGLGI